MPAGEGPARETRVVSGARGAAESHILTRRAGKKGVRSGEEPAGVCAGKAAG